MSRTRNQLWPLLLLLVVCAVLPKLYLTKPPEVAPDGPWIDLMQVWRPDEDPSAYRFWLPAPQPLVVTLVKHEAGSRNRSWEIRAESSNTFTSLPVPIRRTGFGQEPPFELVGKVLTTRELIDDDDNLPQSRPAIWYRRKSNSWQFCTYQTLQVRTAGTINIVPRSKIDMGQECEYGEGFFTWQPGSRWVKSDCPVPP